VVEKELGLASHPNVEDMVKVCDVVTINAPLHPETENLFNDKLLAERALASPPIFLPSRAPELNPVENVWRYLRQNWLANTVFEDYDAIVDAACAARRKLIAQPETITSIGMRHWAHVGQPL
jgi:transposase